MITACVAAGLLPALSPARGAETEEGFVPLFNGKDTTGWVGNPKYWSVAEGAIVGQTTKENPTPHNSFLTWKGGLVSDFVLRFSYRTTPGNEKNFVNSGVQYRSQTVNPAEFVAGGYQADIEYGDNYSGILYDEAGVAGGRGIMAERGQKVVWTADNKKEVLGELGKSSELQAAIKKNDWNEYEVIVQGYHFIHKINGVTMVDVQDNSPKHRPTGILAFQVHAGEPMKIEFKNVRLKNLDRKIVLVAGGASHGKGDHEHAAGCQLFTYCLRQMTGVQPVYVAGGWPADPKVFENAAAIVVYSDGGGGHPFIQGDRLQVLDGLMKKGVGLGLLHYGVEVPKDKGGPEFLAWAGGYFETYWSVNPFWEADFKALPEHPITRGVKPFKQNDEWYYHMRFPEGMKNVTPILSAVPPDATRGKAGANDPHGGNPEVQKHMGEPEHVMWAIERPDGGRGFGFTGGHSHAFWGNPDYRKVVLNAILWIAKAEVPPQGLEVAVTEAMLKDNLDKKN